MDKNQSLKNVEYILDKFDDEMVEIIVEAVSTEDEKLIKAVTDIAKRIKKAKKIVDALME